MRLFDGFWRSLLSKYGTNMMMGPCICVLKTDRARCSLLKTAVLSSITHVDFELKCEAFTGSHKGYLGLQPLLDVFYFRIKNILMTDVHVCNEISVNLVLYMSLGLVARKSQNEIKSLV